MTVPAGCVGSYNNLVIPVGVWKPERYHLACLLLSRSETPVVILKHVLEFDVADRCGAYGYAPDLGVVHMGMHLT
jgi:hypothetical protein